MKKLLLLLIIASIGGTGYYFYRHNQEIEAKRIAEEKLAQEKARLAEEKAAAEVKRLAEGKRIAEEKAAAEAKRLAEEKRIAEEKRLAAEAAKPEVKLAKAREALNQTEPAWLPIRDQLRQLSAAKGSPIDQQNINLDIKNQAISIKQQITTAENQLITLKQNQLNTKNAIRKVNTGLSTGHSGSMQERYSGWYYVNNPNKIYPISTVNGRDRSKRIGYVSKQQENKDNETAALNTQLTQIAGNIEQNQQQKDRLTKQLAELQQHYYNYINERMEQIRKSAATLLTQRKQLREQIKELESKVGVAVASTAIKKTGSETSGEQE